MRVPFVFSVVLGALLALCGLPLPWSALSFVPLAGLLWLIAAAPTPRRAAWLAFWGGFAYFTVQLTWLPESFGTGFGPFGIIMFLPVFALEGLFLALTTWVIARLVRWPEARVWALTGGWVILEWLRHLGPFAFPWSLLGYTTLPTPAVQTADLWGVLGLSLLVTLTAAALARLIGGQWRPALALALVWAGSVAYGVTRHPAQGPEAQMLLLRTDLNSFDKAVGTPLIGRSLTLSQQAQPGEVVAWSETAVNSAVLSDPLQAQQLPKLLITGVSYPGWNAAVSWNGQVESRYDKVKLVPFGEYFPLKDALRPLYDWIFARLGFAFDMPDAGTHSTPLTLSGTRYGTYICYDDVFSQLARQQVRNGAEVLVNVSNDGWFKGWGVEQHFMMGRVRAIETRRWVLRSVNDGVAGFVNDLGQVQARLDTGEDVLHARFARLNAVTPYVRFGDAPVLGASALLILGAVIADGRIHRRRRLY